MRLDTKLDVLTFDALNLPSMMCSRANGESLPAPETSQTAKSLLLIFPVCRVSRQRVCHAKAESRMRVFPTWRPKPSKLYLMGSRSYHISQLAAKLLLLAALLLERLLMASKKNTYKTTRMYKITGLCCPSPNKKIKKAGGNNITSLVP